MIRLPWRYTGWLLRDMARGPLLVLAVMLLAGLFIPVISVNGGSMPAAAVFPYLLEACGFIGVLALTRSIANKDLGRGYYRLFFSRPVDPGGYYLLRWLLGGVALNIFAALLTGIVAWKYGAQLPLLYYVSQLSLHYLVLGGLVFLLSSLLPADIGAVLPLCALSAYAHSSFSPGWLSALAWLLPPLNLTRVTATLPPGVSRLPAVIYGVCAVAAAVAVLQKRRFAEGGRGD